jgi:transcriptional regulator with GAF, ATPase, and Fis domain
MSFSVDELARIAIDLQSDIGHADRFSRLITTLRQILGCDASALLRYEAHQFVPLAIDGLAQDVLVGALPWKDTRGLRRLRVPGMWCASRRIAICPTPMTG